MTAVVFIQVTGIEYGRHAVDDRIAEISTQFEAAIRGLRADVCDTVERMQHNQWDADMSLYEGLTERLSDGRIQFIDGRYVFTGEKW